MKITVTQEISVEISDLSQLLDALIVNIEQSPLEEAAFDLMGTKQWNSLRDDMAHSIHTYIYDALTASNVNTNVESGT